MWYAPLGFCISLFGGWIISVILELLGMAGESTIYTDDSKDIINADLFTPPLAKRIQIRNNAYLSKNFAVISIYGMENFKSKVHFNNCLLFFTVNKW